MYKKQRDKYAVGRDVRVRMFKLRAVKFFDKYYNVLGIPPNSDDALVKSAYRRLAKRYHPDRSGDDSTRAKFIEVNEAYELLMNKQMYIQEAIKRYQQKYGSVQQNPGMSHMRERARAHADMPFNEFENTRIYRTAMVVNSAADYFFLFVGFIMILSPIVGYFSDMEDATLRGEEPEFNLYPIIFGIFFIYGVWYFVFRNTEEELE